MHVRLTFFSDNRLEKNAKFVRNLAPSLAERDVHMTAYCLAIQVS